MLEIIRLPENGNSIRLPEVMKRTGLARSTIYKMMAAKKFPRNFPLTGKAVGWLDTQIQKWIWLQMGWTETDIQNGIQDRIKESQLTMHQ